MEPDPRKAGATILHFGDWPVSVSMVPSSFLRQPLRLEAAQADNGHWFATSVAAATRATTGQSARGPAPAVIPHPASPAGGLAPPASLPRKGPFSGRDVKPAGRPLLASVPKPGLELSARTPPKARPSMGGLERKPPALTPVQRPAFVMPPVVDDPDDPLNDLPF
jgi:hypothetical protein